MTFEEFEIESEGMMQVYNGKWVQITTRIEVKKETEKAYFGALKVFEDDYNELYSDSETWIPKSMAENVWWICTVKFEHAGKVSNRRFEV